MTVIVVTGLPGSGKTTTASALSFAMALPMLSRDRIKELLAEALAAQELEPDTHSIGRVAGHVLLGLLRDAPVVLAEAFFAPGLAEPELLALGRPLIQVHCACDAPLARRRFDERLTEGTRHWIHHAFDQWDRFADSNGLLALPGPLITVDTTRPVDIDGLADDIRLQLGLNN